MTGAEELADLLGLTDWREPMLAVPREKFVPARGIASPECAASYLIDRDTAPNDWLGAVYSDASITTQRDDGKTDPLDITGLPTSSISAPGVAYGFLDLLAPRDHDRVLEIGTGTGYSAAVLSARLGAENVTSIEIDPDVAKQAAVNLEAAGYAPGLIVGDGANGYPEAGPYDRVHVTAGTGQIPYAWIEQTRPGGIIVAPWQPHRGHGLQLRLTVVGESAHGRFHGAATYMMLRSHRAEAQWKPHHHEEADVTMTRLDPRTVASAGPGADLALTGRIPGMWYFGQTDSNGSFSLLLFEVGDPDGSWAACDYEPGKDEFEVTQYGRRRLWDEAAEAFEWWVRAGAPASDRFGLTVTSEGEQLWLDEPTRCLTS